MWKEKNSKEKNTHETIEQINKKVAQEEIKEALEDVAENPKVDFDDESSDSKNENSIKEGKKSKKENSSDKELEEKNKEIANLTELTINQMQQIFQLKAELEKNQKDYIEKAKSFQKDAQDKINEFKTEYSAKMDEEKNNIKKFSIQKLVEQIINPLLNIELAITAGKKQGPEVQAYVMGFEMLMNMLYQSMESFGIASIIPSEGDEFDPHIHEILEQVDGPHNKIVSVVKRGIKLYDRVVKPAVVKVGK